MLESQLGTGDKKDQLENPVLSIKYKKILSVCCGEYHSVILLEDGQLLGFGDARGLEIKTYGFSILQPSLLMKDNTIKTISCGADFTLAQTMNGEVFHPVSQIWKKSRKNILMKDASIKFIQQKNFIDEWIPENHQNCSNQFKEIVFNFLLCLKMQRIKVPKFVFFIIVRQIYDN